MPDNFFTLIDNDNKATAAAAKRGKTQPATKKKKKAKPEAAIQSQIVRWLIANGAVATRVNSGFMRDDNGNVFRGADAGTADIICCWRGRYCAIECKAGNNKPTPKQQKFLNKVLNAGGIALVANSLEVVKAALDKVAPLG